jgi:hypothetical protein
VDPAEVLRELGFEPGEELSPVTHQITHHRITARRFAAGAGKPPAGSRLVAEADLPALPLSSLARKLLHT